jgi:hypothetical protein
MKVPTAPTEPYFNIQNVTADPRHQDDEIIVWEGDNLKKL